jgi:DNA-binding NarL/FixJ family response regulator
MNATGTKRALRVLLVEDSPRIAELVRDLVEAANDAEVIHVADDETGAIKAVREHDADVMILDLQLKHGTGFGVLKALGDARPTTIIMTNYALPQYQAKAKAHGIEFFLDKAVDFERLPSILAEIGRQQTS